jgi:hypothetical protein
MALRVAVAVIGTIVVTTQPQLLGLKAGLPRAGRTTPIVEEATLLM